MNRKGQALIEFVLILPILILILFSVIDFGNIFYSKYELQHMSSDIVKLVQDGKGNDDILSIYSNIDIDIEDFSTDYKKIVVSKRVSLITPIMDSIFGNPYLIEVERIIPNE